MLKKFEVKPKVLLLVASYWLSRMKLLLKRYFGIPMSIFVAMLLSGLVITFLGCVVRTYPVTKERVDQELTTGNRGYLKGQVPVEAIKERKTTRTTQVVEIELRSPIKFEKAPQDRPQETKAVAKIEDEEVFGNRGYITQSKIPKIIETKPIVAKSGYEKYTVEKGDTLQKISKEFYGTTQKWNKIYQANKDVLGSSDKIYPGQVLNIPFEELKEPKENLK